MKRITLSWIAVPEVTIVGYILRWSVSGAIDYTASGYNMGNVTSIQLPIAGMPATTGTMRVGITAIDDLGVEGDPEEDRFAFDFTVVPVGPPPIIPTPSTPNLPAWGLRQTGSPVWAFTKQWNKPNYNEAVRIAPAPGYPGGSPVWAMTNAEFGDSPITPHEHDPWCGYWPTLPYVAPVVPPTLPEPVFVVRDAPFGGGGTSGRDRCYKRDKDLVELSYYGEEGSGIDQLHCPFSVAADDTYIWITDVVNKRLMKRLKSDLTYVAHRGGIGEGDEDFTRECVHAATGSLIWVGTVAKLEELNKTTLATVRTYTPTDPAGPVGWAFDITCDETYLYVADQARARVIFVDRATLQYQGEFGVSGSFGKAIVGIAYTGGYMYTSDYTLNKICKIEPVSYARYSCVGTLPAQNPFGTLGQLAAYGTNVFATSYYGLLSLSATDLSLLGICVDPSDPALWYPNAVAADADYAYAAFSYTIIEKIDVPTCGWVAENGDRTGATHDGEDAYSSIFGVAVDGTYLYVLDQNDDVRVIRRLKSDLSYVDEYNDAWLIFSNPNSLTVDGTYIYVIDGASIHRINKATMAYVDALSLTTETQGQQMVLVGDGTFYSAGLDENVQHYTLATMELLDSSPASGGDSNFWLDEPHGITCDEDNIYVTNMNYSVSPTVAEVKIYDRAAKTYVDKFTISMNLATSSIQEIAVDDTYLYVAIFSVGAGASYSKKYLKASPYTEIASAEEEYATGIDTAYVYQLT